MTVATVTDTLKPLILLADSQLLFYQENGQAYMNRIKPLLGPGENITAAYIGASNGDEVQFYDLFELAMHRIGIYQCKHITSELNPAQLNFVTNAQVILLAGGNVWRGWQTLSKIAPLIHAARRNGAVIIGTSAGAIQLGALGCRSETFINNTDLFATLGYIPAIFGAHEEKQQWSLLRQMISQTGGCIPGIGIPAGAGLIVTPDNLIEAIRKPAVSFTVKGGKLVEQQAWKIQLRKSLPQQDH